MARAAQIYDFTLTANGTFVLPVEGSFYRIRTSTGAVGVRRDDGSILSPIYEGQGEQDRDYKRLTIIDRSGAANSGTIIVADNYFVDERVAGEVSTISGGFARSLANAAYAGGSSIGPLAGNYSALQLWNPTGSNKNLVITDVIANSYTASTNTMFRSANAALTALVGNPVAKLMGGAASVAEMRSDQTPAMAGVGNLLPFVSASTSISSQYRFDEPIVLPPNTGLIISGSIVNAAMIAAFQFWERPLT